MARGRIVSAACGQQVTGVEGVTHHKGFGRCTPTVVGAYSHKNVCLIQAITEGQTYLTCSSGAAAISARRAFHTAKHPIHLVSHFLDRSYVHPRRTETPSPLQHRRDGQASLLRSFLGDTDNSIKSNSNVARSCRSIFSWRSKPRLQSPKPYAKLAPIHASSIATWTMFCESPILYISVLFKSVLQSVHRVFRKKPFRIRS